MTHRFLSAVVYGVTMAVGLIAFLYPFWNPHLARAMGQGQAHAGDAALMLTLLVGLCFVVLLLEVQGQAISAKMVALLGVLVAVNALLRFVEVAIPGPGGFSPIFLLIILTGYVFGARFGFLMGALTLFVSALITGSAGPWLPYQMFTAGWMGMSAPICRPLVKVVGGEGRWPEAAVLAIFSGAWGLLYGIIMNIWFWPFIVGDGQQYWAPGSGPLEVMRSYALFYVATSLIWDLLRLVGNVALMLLFGLPAVRAMRRFQRRFAFVYLPDGTGLPGEEQSMAGRTVS